MLLEKRGEGEKRKERRRGGEESPSQKEEIEMKTDTKRKKTDTPFGACILPVSYTHLTLPTKA